MGGMLTDMSTTQDNMSAFQQVIPSADRDFARPKENFMAMVYPETADLSQVEDSFSELQEALKNSPFGSIYQGPIDGKKSSELLHAIKRLEILLQASLGEFIIGSLVTDGDKIQTKKIIKYLNDFKKKSQQPSKDDSEKDKILQFQKFLSETHPIIGKIYSGPTDGKINSDLITALQKVEHKFLEKIPQEKIEGILWNPQTHQISTTVEDLNQALLTLVTMSKTVISNKLKSLLELKFGS